MIDEERVTRLLGRIASDVTALRGFSQVPAEVLVVDDLRLSAVKYRFLTAIEGCSRVAHHLCASQGWAAPDTNAEAVRELARHDVLAPALAESLARAAGFRNLLVHQYAEVDDHRVVAHLAHLDDLDDYVMSVAAWVRDAAD